MKLLSHVWLFTIPWTAAYQAPPSMGFSRQEYWSGVPLPKWTTWVQSQKRQSDLCSFPRQTIQYHGNPCNPTSNAEEAEVKQFYEDLQHFLELTPGDWNAKVGSQETPGVIGKFGLRVQNEAGWRLIRLLPRERTGHSKHPLPTTQEKTLHMDITTWSTPKSHWFYSLQAKMEKFHQDGDTVSKNKTRGWLWLRSWTPYCQIQI